MNLESREISSMLARRYAQAFLSVYGEQVTAQTGENLVRFKQFLVANRALIYLFTIPSIDQKTKERGLGFLAEKFELPRSFYSLMVLLLFSRRISLLPQVLYSVVALYKKEHGIQSFAIHSSHALSGPELDQLRDFLTEQIANKQSANQGADLVTNIGEKNNSGHDNKEQKNIHVVCSYKQDKDLIAGIRMQSETYLWEHSIARQLRAIELLLLR